MSKLTIFILAVFIFLLLIILGQLIFNKLYNFPQHLSYGVTFSPRHTTYLGLNWKETFIKILDELGVKQLRIPVYWDEIEKQEGIFKFDDIDFMLEEADQRGAKTILVVGLKQPRWPECYMPLWIKEKSKADKRMKILKFIEETVKKYRENDAVWAIQVENEPLLPFFGEGCDDPDANFLKTEVDLVRKLTSKKVIISDSGEFGLFIIPMQLSDVFGTTLYRKTYDPLLKYKTYPLLPYLYNVKSSLVRKLFAPQNDKTIIIELQAEPWLSADLSNTTADQQADFFTVNELKETLNYAQKTGFDTAYLWGVEWWYFMEEHGHPRYLEFAKSLFR